MVAIEVLDQVDDLILQCMDDDLNLSRSVDELDHLLQSPGTVLVKRDSDHISGGVLDQDGALCVIAELKELLAQVIAEGIGHELNDVCVGLLPDHVHLLGNTVLQLLLEVAATVLVLTKGVDATYNLLERQVMETAHG